MERVQSNCGLAGRRRGEGDPGRADRHFWRGGASPPAAPAPRCAAGGSRTDLPMAGPTVAGKLGIGSPGPSHVGRPGGRQTVPADAGRSCTDQCSQPRRGAPAAHSGRHVRRRLVRRRHRLLLARSQARAAHPRPTRTSPPSSTSTASHRYAATPWPSSQPAFTDSSNRPTADPHRVKQAREGFAAACLQQAAFPRREGVDGAIWRRRGGFRSSRSPWVSSRRLALHGRGIPPTAARRPVVSRTCLGSYRDHLGPSRAAPAR